jgi:hypothetical protein
MQVARRHRVVAEIVRFALWCTVFASVVLSAVQPGHESPVALADLTVPAERLAAGCSLPSSPSLSVSGNVGMIRGGLWTGLPIPTNPWRGADPPIVAAVRERVDGPFLEPDGPILGPGERARFRLRFAEGVHEAYAAIYADAGPYLVTVYAVTLDSAVAPLPRSPQFERHAESQRRAGVRFTRGRTRVMVAGDASPCFEAVAAHVRDLTTR